FDQIPKHLRDAVIAAEDPSFYEHEGLDYWGILRAVVSNVAGGRIGPGRWGQGGSTITQQVVKQLVLSPEKTPRRKIQEMILARRLSKQLSKDEILSIYLNHINYGEGHYGCEEAAQYFFGKSVREITVAEAAFMAGIPQRPEQHSPYKNPDSAKSRQLYVLRQMVEHKYLDHATADRYAKEDVRVVPRQRNEGPQAPEAVGTVYRLLAEKYGAEAIPALGAEVRTTLDLPLQKLARTAVERGLEALDQRQGYRGPQGHLEGAKLTAYRNELKIARLMGKGGDSAKEGAALAKKTKPRFNLDPIRESQIFEGVVDKVVKGTGEDKGRLQFDVGGQSGTVDLNLEPRYAQDTKFVNKFRVGDLVRVRFAPERRRGAKDDGVMPLALEMGPQAAMVVLDPRTREVLALVGGYGYRAGGYDRSQRAFRQCGSTFKPFVYAAAIDSGKFTAASVLNDTPQVYEKWKPQNYEKESFRGPVRLRTALADSINTIPISLASSVGLPAVMELATRAGFTTPWPGDVGLSLALGANSVTPLELANAFATFVTGGERLPYRMISTVDGEALTPLGDPVRAMKPETAYVMISLMRSVVTEGTGRAAGARLKRPIAGKTGTSSQGKDGWFVGFTPDLLAAVWLGFDDSKPLGKGETGGHSAVPIWTEFMAKALADRPASDFVAPPGVEVVRIDPATGLLPPAGAEGMEEVFIDGTAPKELAGSADEAGAADRLLLQGAQP
ncbi:MAG TPA: PBP1A family penicillin-binding protein, partial [Polyangia bacterium]